MSAFALFAFNSGSVSPRRRYVRKGDRQGLLVAAPLLRVRW